MRAVLARGLAAGSALWGFLRRWSGDADYEIYRSRVDGAAALSREQFWLETLKRRYDRVSRCC